ncbi:hypothetical protein [Archangium sp.]|uniref:NAD(P)/FAD-dependent oxidoreductase n=1 Tax=Archangium sp. TaxID=1872627 RepID=UPI00286A1470|nr:hypothetical protein [Archangium sp.]
MSLWDVAVVGGEPTGLAVALTTAKRGLRTVVLERAAVPPDKACGEGLMPSGVAALERFGALALLERGECSPFVGIRYVQEDGSGAEGRLPASGGLGVRRVALVRAMAARALRGGGAAAHGAGLGTGDSGRTAPGADAGGGGRAGLAAATRRGAGGGGGGGGPEALRVAAALPDGWPSRAPRPWATCSRRR